MIVCIIILNFSSIIIQQNEANERSSSTFEFSQVLEFLKNPQILKISIFFFFMQVIKIKIVFYLMGAQGKKLWVSILCGTKFPLYGLMF